MTANADRRPMGIRTNARMPIDTVRVAAGALLDSGHPPTCSFYLATYSDSYLATYSDRCWPVRVERALTRSAGVPSNTIVPPS